jgi:cytochrome c oxidase subunit IV
MENNTEINAEHSQNSGYGLYISVWIGLVGLTAITVALAGVNLAGIAVATALAIAIIKAGMVANYFMHVKFDNKIFKVFIAICLVIFLIMIILTFFDLTYRNPVK